CLEFGLDGESCTPREALQFGIVDRLFEPTVLVEETVAWAERVAAQAGRVGLVAAKRGILDTANLSLTEALAVDSSLHWEAMQRGRFLAGGNGVVGRFGQGVGRRWRGAAR